MVSQKIPKEISPDGAHSESLFIRLARAHAATSYASVATRYLGDGVPLYVDHNR